jgi:hypothetical protein
MSNFLLELLGSLNKFAGISFTHGTHHSFVTHIPG